MPQIFGPVSACHSTNFMLDSQSGFVAVPFRALEAEALERREDEGLPSFATNCCTFLSQYPLKSPFDKALWEPVCRKQLSSQFLCA